MNPLWNSLVVCGFREGEPFLGYVDLLGTSYKDEYIATGYDNNLYYIKQKIT